jgi:type I restriction enzyme S subunit
VIFDSMRFGDLGQIFDGPHATPTRQSEGPFFLNIASLVDGRLDLAQSDHVTSEDFVRWTKRVTPTEDDLLFSYETRLGDAGLMPSGVEACLGRRMALLRPNRQIVDPRFLLYFYLSPAFRTIIERHTIHGATVNRIGLSTMGAWPVSIPDLNEQRAIGEVLGALDAKIGANIKLARTMDDYYLALWGELTLQGGIANAKLTDLLADTIGGDWGVVEPTVANTEEVYCIRGADISDLQGTGRGRMPRRFIKASSRRRRRLADGDIVVEMSGGSPTQSTGRSVLVTDGLLRRLDLPLISSNFCRTLRLNDPRYSYFVYALLRNSWNRGDFYQFENGSTGIKNLAFADFCQGKMFPAPTSRDLLIYNGLASRLVENMQSLGAESENLAAIRDAMLPALMSGKIRVRDAEQMVGDVA